MNLIYEITLKVTKEEGDSEPVFWDWQTLIDSPYPVFVVDCNQIAIGDTENA